MSVHILKTIKIDTIELDQWGDDKDWTIYNTKNDHPSFVNNFIQKDALGTLHHFNSCQEAIDYGLEQGLFTKTDALKALITA